MYKNYTICDQKIRINMLNFPSDSADWRLFETSENSADISVTCQVGEKLPEAFGKFCGEQGEFQVFSDGEKVFRKRQMGIAEGVLAEYDCKDGNNCNVSFTTESFPIMTDERFFWSSVPLAQLLLPKKVVLMHASHIDINGESVLFTAPCGTGKSTQAELWRVHRNAEVINGDKAGICLKDEKAFACGVPFCGTSKICKNRKLPLKAIVVLSQGKENRVKRLTGFEALQGVVNNIYLDLLAPGERQMCIDFVIELLEKVNVFSLECTPDERAVIAFEKVL
ncbi:MAG: hypothetical protein UGF89_01115 [Acutalibacteraceae bacterium]|nr:hypothetical protein [Acutalibacteraceae bacterium]